MWTPPWNSPLTQAVQDLLCAQLSRRSAAQPVPSLVIELRKKSHSPRGGEKQRKESPQLFEVCRWFPSGPHGLPGVLDPLWVAAPPQNMTLGTPR